MSPPTKSKLFRLRLALRFAERVLAITGVLFLVYHGGFNLTTITSPSMSPTLQGESFATGDWVLTERLTKSFRTPRRWELIQFRDSEGTFVIKRVVGLPGETVALKQGKIEINGRFVTRPKGFQEIKYYAFGNLRAGSAVKCEQGFYVLGDKSDDSQDSRFEGPVAPDDIVGRSVCVVWPANRIHFLSP
jgi:signal peptidase I